jgi:hypothetical protein
MWYWDYIPSWWQHHKKSLTKWQIKKLQAAYATAGAITESVKFLEKEEQAKIQSEIKKDLNLLF